MSETLELSAFFPGLSAERLYRAWLDATEHTAMTGRSIISGRCRLIIAENE